MNRQRVTGKTLRTINKELWLLLSLVLIAAMIHFLVASQAVALVFFFLPTLYSAYHFGRRHATLTAFASVCVVILLTYVTPSMLTYRLDYTPLDSRWFDITVWGGVLVVTAYAMGTLYEHNQKGLRDLKSGYDGMLVILQQFLSNQKNSDADSIRVATYATKIADALGLDPASSEDLRTAALLRNVNEIGISNELLYKAVNMSQEELESGMRKGKKRVTRAQLMGGSLSRAIPILVAAQQLRSTGASPASALIEVQILNLAEKFDSRARGEGAEKSSTALLVEKIAKESPGDYDSMVVDAFVKAFGQRAQAAAQ
jgi:hypothetical protein